MIYSKSPRQDPRGLVPKYLKEKEDSLYIQIEDELLGEDWLDSYATTILDAKYKKADILKTVNSQWHLNAGQRNDLFRVIKEHESLFYGTLGVCPHKQFHIELKPDHTLGSRLHYLVPRVHSEVFRRELNHLVKLGVVEPQGLSRWVSPSFIHNTYIPKKDSTVR